MHYIPVSTLLEGDFLRSVHSLALPDMFATKKYFTRIFLDLIMIRIHDNTDRRCKENGPAPKLMKSSVYVYTYDGIHVFSKFW